jgi:spectinomycin phosphotransferase
VTPGTDYTTPGPFTALDGIVGGADDAPSTRQLTSWVRDDYDLELGDLTPVGSGGDEAADLWRAVAADGTPYAVKLSSGGTPAGDLLTSHLAASGLDGVLAPLRTRAGRLAADHLGRRLTVTPWAPGDPALDVGLSPRQWQAFGSLLGATHRTDVTGDLAAALPWDDLTHAAITERVRATIARLAVAPADETTTAVWHEWSEATDRIAALSHHTALLSAALRPTTHEHVVCHGDPHLGNLLADRNGMADRVWLVDWDDAVLAPRECDLMFVLGGVLAFAPVGDADRVAFFAGYGDVTVDPRLVAYYLGTRALDDVAGWAAQAADPHDAERDRALDIVRGILSPPGLVDVALSAVAKLR